MDADAAPQAAELRDIQVEDSDVLCNDGNVIIAVVDEQRNARHLLKCHRGVLSARLPALRDMFDAGGDS